MALVLVRVKQGHRLRENGCNWVEGQTFYVEEARVSSLADQVDVVQGVTPVRAAAILSPPRTLEVPQSETLIPSPDPKLKPREIAEPEEEDAPEKKGKVKIRKSGKRIL